MVPYIRGCRRMDISNIIFSDPLFLEQAEGFENRIFH
jgi:hypothetical protein